MQHTFTRRRSPNLTVTLKETERSPPCDLSVHHRQPWNKYCKEVPSTKLKIELSQPSREEFVRIRNWSIEKRKFEERQAELERQRCAILERQKTESLEAKQRVKRCAVLEDVRQRQEKRVAMQKEREMAQERYLSFRQASRLTPLLHELRQREFDKVLPRISLSVDERGCA